MNRTTFVVTSMALALGASLTLDASQILIVPTQDGGAKLALAPFRLEAGVVKGQPYSAEILTESVNTLGDGNRIVHRATGRVYRDVEGRVRREDDRPSGTPTVMINDPVAGKRWTLDAASRTAREANASVNVRVIKDRIEQLLVKTRETPLAATGRGGVAAGGRGGQMVARGAGAGGATGRRVEETLPNRSIENLLCSGVRRTTTIEAGVIGNEQPIRIVSEEWTSIDLQVLVLTELTDPRTGKSTYALSKVSRANPDAALFKVPAGYTITGAGGGRGRGGN